MTCNEDGADTKAPYEELDSNIVSLVRALNSFDGIQTAASCGGHPDPNPVQMPQGSWRIAFHVSHCEQGWLSLEFLSWFVNDKTAGEGHQVILLPNALPPLLNTPGEALYFLLDGFGDDPDRLAKDLMESKKKLFVTPEELEKLEEEFERSLV